MYKVLGSYRQGEVTYYAVSDGVSAEPEIISSRDLSILVDFNLEAVDSVGNRLYVENGQLVCLCDDITDKLMPSSNEYEFDDEDFDEDDYGDDFDEDDYGDDFEEEDFEEDEEDDEEDYDDYEEDIEDYDEEEDEDYEDDDFDDYDDFGVEEDEITEFYNNWISGADVTISSDSGVESEGSRKLGKDFSDLSDSTESKLYSYLSDEQKKLLQEYYLYISKRIFNLERGVNDLPIKRRKDLDAVRNTGDSWAYAGFIDMGYAGTSICPNCGSSLSQTALSDCHNAPVVRWAVSRGKKSDGQRMLARTYNGVCSHPSCRKHCAVVTDEVGVRQVDRSNQNGIVCERCGSHVSQSSHYCTFNDPVRYMHLAWDTSVSDMDINFYGQMVNSSIESLIDSNNCIKFGLTCTAEFFDIAKNSEAFKALESVQNVCKADMELLCEAYENGSKSIICSSFGILDSIVDKLILLSTKIKLLKNEDYLPTRLLQLYKDMRTADMIIPKSFIQFIRDFLVDWDTHKFIDRSKKFPNLYGSVGSIGGAKTNTSGMGECYDRLCEVLMGVWGKKANALCNRINIVKSSRSRSYYGVSSISSHCIDYAVAFFIYELCGYYKYDAINQGDEGGKDQDKDGYGKHAVELRSFYTSIKRGMPNDIEFTSEYMSKVLEAVSVVEELQSLFDFNFVSKVLRKRIENDAVVYYIQDCSEDENLRSRSIVYPFKHYDDRLEGVLSDGTGKLVRLFRDSAIDNFISGTSELLSYMHDVTSKFRDFEIQYLEEEVEKRNVKSLKKEDKVVSSIADAQSFLLSADLSSVDSKKYNFALKVLEQLRSSGKEATFKQFYYMKDLYEELSGNKFEMPKGDSKEVDSDIMKAVDWCLENDTDLDDFTIQVLKTIKRKGTVSDKQMRFAQKAVDIYKKEV